MTVVHKDSIGQNLSVGDFVTYPTSLSSTRVGIITKLNSVMVRVGASSCYPIATTKVTETLKTTGQVELMNDLIDKYKEYMDYTPPKQRKPIMTYSLSILKGLNKLYTVRVLVVKDNKFLTNSNISVGRYITSVSVSLIRRDVSFYPHYDHHPSGLGFTVGAGDFISGRRLKSLIGYVPLREENIAEDLTKQDLTDMFDEATISLKGLINI